MPEKIRNLRTSPHDMLFTDDVRFSATSAAGEMIVSVDRDLFHRGYVVDDPGSAVHLSVHRSGGLYGVGAWHPVAQNPLSLPISHPRCGRC